MQRILTEEEITALADAGVNMNGVPPGAEATPDEIIELERLGLQPAAAPVAAAPVAAPAITDDRSPGGNLAVEPMPAAPAATSPAPAANNMATLQTLLATQAPPPPADPYENLSKTQRRMLAFAGLADAGAALQGIQGGNVNAMLGRFNEQADMQRKATAAQAQRQMLQGVMAGGAGTDPQARIQQLLNIAMVNPSMAPAIALQVKQIQDQQKEMLGMEGKASSAAGQLETMQEIINMIDADPAMTTGPMAMFLRNVPFTQAGQTQALVDSLRSTLALDTLKDLKSTGATMGALNKEELNILLDDVTKLDLALGPEAVKKSLAKIDRRYKDIVRGLYRGASEEGMAQLDANFKGRPAWLDPSSDAPAQDETQEEFKKRMGL